MLVTKTVPVPQIQEAFDAGMRDFGESRVQEFLGKKSALSPEIHWHFVGHLQTNKVKTLLEIVGAGFPRPSGQAGAVTAPLLLHSLDRLPLAGEIQKQAEKRKVTVEALIQVNTTAEAAKSGFSPEEVEEAVRQLSEFSKIKLRGLMTIGPTAGDEQSIRSSFRKLRELRDRLNRDSSAGGRIHELSMGMSSDFEIAIEEGATILRIGTAVFGERK